MMHLRNLLKGLVSNKPGVVRIRRGPFRDARVVMNPYISMRKIWGIYEHELNSWIEDALSRVSRVIDVGAYDGYYTFGAGAFFERSRIEGEVIAIEGGDTSIDKLETSLTLQKGRYARYRIIKAFAGSLEKGTTMTLNSINEELGDPRGTLIKIDVEGMECEVMRGALSWIRPSTFFVIEVHRADLLAELHGLFREHGHPVVEVKQRPFPILGRENRELDNMWLVSDLERLDSIRG